MDQSIRYISILKEKLPSGSQHCLPADRRSGVEIVLLLDEQISIMVPKVNITTKLDSIGNAEKMVKILAVGLGGAAGSVGRYLVAVLADKTSSLNFPFGTFCVNVVGSFFIGFCWSYFERTHISNEFRLFLFTGFLGGFTTFSAFTRETVQFIKADEPYHAFFYMLLSNFTGIAAVMLGFFISSRILR